MPSPLSSLFIACVQPINARLRRGVDAQPGLAGLAGDRRHVHDERVAVLRAGGPQQRRALAVEEDHRAQVHGELEVDALGRGLARRRRDARRRRVDEHVEAPVAVAVGGDEALYVVLVGDVARDRLDLAPASRARRRRRELVGAARRERSPWPSSPSILAMARPMPLDAPVTRAARQAWASPFRGYGRQPARRIKAARAPAYDRGVPDAIVDRARAGPAVSLAFVLDGGGRGGAATAAVRPDPSRGHRGAGRARARPAFDPSARAAPGHTRTGAPRGRRDARRGLPAGAAGAPTRRCSPCSGCCRRASTSARGRRRASRRPWPATTTRAGTGCGSSRAPRRPTACSRDDAVAHELTHALEDQRGESSSRGRRGRRQRRSLGSRSSRAPRRR